MNKFQRTAENGLSALSEAERARAMQRYERLRPHLEAGVPLARLATESGVSLRTLRRHLADYRRQGLSGLVARPRSDRGGVHFPEVLRTLIEGLALQSPRPSVRSVYRRVRRVALERDWRVPGYRSVAIIIQKLPAGMTVLAHDGTKAYKNAFDLLYRREAERPNEIWQADHTPFDIWVFDENGVPGQPWFTAVVDDHSRAVAGWRLYFTAPSSVQTSLTLRQAVWRKSDPRWHVCGIPGTLYTDHGADFTSKHFKQVAVDLKFAPVYSIPGEPRGRGRIERCFGVVNQLFLCEQPGYSPPRKPAAKPVLTIGELTHRLGEFLIGDYNLRIHPETGVAPQERWEVGGFLPRMPESLEALDLLLLTVAEGRVVQRDGIHFETLRYMDSALAAYVGELVTIRYDPLDLAEIRVFHRDRFLCRAICPELSGETVSLKEIVRARRARRRELREAIRRRRQTVEELLELKKSGPQLRPVSSPATLPPVKTGPRLKLYFNE